MNMKNTSLSKLKKLYSNGGNITELLKDNCNTNSINSIEAAYDLQSGNYTKNALNNKDKMDLYISEVSSIIQPYLNNNDRVLDCGTGEMTTITGIANKIFPDSIKLYCFDISLSRILWGVQFCKEFMKKGLLSNVRPFVATLSNIPMLDNSIDIICSSHALEPNHGKESEILSEIFRVACKKVILFEPSYESNTKEGKERMEGYGYIRNLPEHIKKNNGKLEYKIKIKNTINPLNPTYAYIITPPNNAKRVDSVFACPVTKSPLVERSDCLYSNQSLFAYPIISSIPILRKKYHIMASHYDSYLIDSNRLYHETNSKVK
jgi:ubiquinone/menaquinone biosynthesis C-methylase UbiE/uncharacterized protein YbaR (Trm112 family)